MKKKNERNNVVLDYTISALLILILVLAMFMAPYAFSAFSDQKEIKDAHVIERENFYFREPVTMDVEARIQNMMELLSRTTSAPTAVALGDVDINSGELLHGILEAIDIAVSCKLIPDITGYEMEKNIVYLEYYNLRDDDSENSETAFFKIRFSDFETFDFVFVIDASAYVIYQAEIYCAEASEYVDQITSDDTEVVQFLNNRFIESSTGYFEAEGYDVLTNLNQSDLAIMMGYERGEYAMYHTTCHYGNLDTDGIRWGFVPMVAAFEQDTATQEWGYKRIEDYFEELYNVEVMEKMEE